jgi:UDP-N-acetylglucosamine--N-acetylmuramyl-(pentapeptide) pyrophosphoryl-undecaprenol N-acetylglucosamine transferase
MQEAANKNNNPLIKAMPFIAKMDLAYAAADVVISRAGALSVSELCLVKKPCVLVPSPNVSEDHQTKNAQSLVNKNAALLVKDVESITKLVPTVLSLLADESQQADLVRGIADLGKPDAAKNIAQEVLNIIAKNKK